MLEDAIKSQQFERMAALLEQGFSPNGERGSSKVGCVSKSKSTSSVVTLTNIDCLQIPRDGRKLVMVMCGGPWAADSLVFC